MKVGDLVKSRDPFMSGLDAGIGIVIQVEEYDSDGLSICVQWVSDFLWYEEKDLEVITGG